MKQLTDKYVYNLIAYRNGVKETLCTYKGDDLNLYNFQVERVKDHPISECCGNSCGECSEDDCTCT